MPHEIIVNNNEHQNKLKTKSAYILALPTALTLDHAWDFEEVMLYNFCHDLKYNVLFNTFYLFWF